MRSVLVPLLFYLAGCSTALVPPVPQGVLVDIADTGLMYEELPQRLLMDVVVESAGAAEGASRVIAVVAPTGYERVEVLTPGIPVPLRLGVINEREAIALAPRDKKVARRAADATGSLTELIGIPLRLADVITLARGVIPSSWLAEARVSRIDDGDFLVQVLDGDGWFLVDSESRQWHAGALRYRRVLVNLNRSQSRITVTVPERRLRFVFTPRLAETVARVPEKTFDLTVPPHFEELSWRKFLAQ